MLLRMFIFLTGFGLTVIGSVYIIAYLNLLSIGYNFLEYVKVISSKIECLFMPIGIVLMIICMYFPKGGNNEIRIWYFA